MQNKMTFLAFAEIMVYVRTLEVMYIVQSTRLIPLAILTSMHNSEGGYR